MEFAHWKDDFMTILETERLIIREYVCADAQLALEYSQESRRRNELPDDVLTTIKDATDYVMTCIENYEKNSDPLSYAVVRREDNILIGEVQLDTIKNGIEISYSISEQFAGNGYTTEAVKSFSAWAKHEKHITPLYGLVKKSNVASWKVLEKAGFSFLYEEKLVYYGREVMFRVYTY